MAADANQHLRAALERHAATARFMVYSYDDNKTLFGPFESRDGDRGRAEADAFVRRMGSDRYFVAIPNFL